MQVGAAMFFTDYSMGAADLAQALEARAFESVWAPEHSHIPTSRRSPYQAGGELPKQYYDVMDPFVTLSAAAAVTKTIKLGTGVCLITQRDPIQTAKLVASLDQVSGGRFLFGIGGGWNAEEMEDHGTEFKTRFKLMRERVEAMRRSGPRMPLNTMASWSISVRWRHGPNRCKSRTRRSSSAAPSHIRRGARCAMATAGSPMRADSNMPTSPISCRTSSRWPQRWGATPARCR
jgi:alkanesulfonate monooxygenase SsuD/methylene tetrahydromethanopterin reductase-like flavin-dependent oxidoreductase (luciferase family)